MIKLTSKMNILGVFVVASICSVAVSQSQWTDLPTGIDICYQDKEHKEQICKTSGVAWGDIDGDGDDDLVLGTNGSGPTCMFMNDGNGGFIRVSDPLLDDKQPVWCPLLGDHDNDGDLDLFAACFGAPSFLLENQDGVFVHCDSGGLFEDLDNLMARGGAWVDYNADGLLDLYVQTNAANPSIGSDKLLRNVGSCYFIDVSPAVFADPSIGRGSAWSDFDNDGDVDLYAAGGKGCPCAWVDDDGNPTCEMPAEWYLRAENRMFSIEKGAFTDVTNTSLPLIDVDHARGVTAGDYDNDGDIDLFICNLEIANDSVITDPDDPIDCSDANPSSYGGFNKLLRNDGNFIFTDVTPPELRPAGGQRGCGWLDYDNDGDLDLLLVAYDGDATTTLFMNSVNAEGNRKFIPVDTLVFGHDDFQGTNGVGCAFSDYDIDGDVDIFITHRNGINRFLRNDLRNENHWMEIKLVGTQSNIGGIGARVKLIYRDSDKTEREQIRDVRTGTSYWSQNSLVQHFGLGGGCPTDIDDNGATYVSDILALIGSWGSCSSDCPADVTCDGDVDTEDLLAVIAAWGDCPDIPEIVKVVVTWPSGIIQEVENGLTIDSRLLITEPAGVRLLNPAR